MCVRVFGIKFFPPHREITAHTEKISRKESFSLENENNIKWKWLKKMKSSGTDGKKFYWYWRQHGNEIIINFTEYCVICIFSSYQNIFRSCFLLVEKRGGMWGASKVCHAVKDKHFRFCLSDTMEFWEIPMNRSQEIFLVSRGRCFIIHILFFKVFT